MWTSLETIFLLSVFGAGILSLLALYVRHAQRVLAIRRRLGI